MERLSEHRPIPQLPSLEKNYLYQETRCVWCLIEENRKNGKFMTRDHLVPELACRDFPRSLGFESGIDLARLDVNLLTLCSLCHRKIDNNNKRVKTTEEGPLQTQSKMKEYRMHGMEGLVRYLSDVYPRSPDQDFLERQEKQFTDLFVTLSNKIPLQIKLFNLELEYLDSKNGTKTDALRGNYTELTKIRSVFEKAEDLVGSSLHKWERGYFALALSGKDC